MKIDKQFQEMLALLRAFVCVNNLSARGVAPIIGVSFSTTARWLDPAYDAYGTYARVTRRVTGIIQALNAEDEVTDLYAAISTLPADERVARLLAATHAWRRLPTHDV